MIRRWAPTALYTVFLSALLYTYATILAGCGGGNGQVAAESARAAACEAAEQLIEDRVEAGELQREDAFLRIDCVRLVCDQMSERIAGEDE